MRTHTRTTLLLTTAAGIAVLLAACGSSGDWSSPLPSASPVGTLGAGFTVPGAPPTPEATITPRPGSWDDVHPPKDYRVVLLTTGSDRPTTTLVDAVKGWAKDEDVSLKVVTADRATDYIPAIERAMKLKPHLIISAGDPLVDALTSVTANHLDQNFLVVGAELAEPTHNVTAADWNGASYRGEGLGTSSDYDPASFTPERAGRAVRAGVASVLTGLTGIVVWLQ